MKYLFTVLFIFIFIADSLTQKVLKARSLENTTELIRSEVPIPDNDERLPYEKLFENDRISISTAYPNPASGFTNFDYQLSDKAKDAKIILSDVFGSVIQEYKLSSQESRLKVNTQLLSSGVYFYTLSLEGKMVITKKLIVRQ
jgi:hypothetical protein